MRRVVPFARILDETLAEMTATAARGPVRPNLPPQVLGFFDFSVAGPQPRPTRTAIPSAWTPTRATRHLTSKQRTALATLVDLGATLHTDFTAAELRTAFRTLARSYHPDRFPAASEPEKARLSRLFAAARAAYATLRACSTPA